VGHTRAGSATTASSQLSQKHSRTQIPILMISHNASKALHCTLRRGSPAPAQVQSLGIALQSLFSTTAWPSMSRLTRVLTVDKVTGSRAHKGLGQVHMLRNGMGWQLLKDQLMHSQPQNGMCGRLQAAASFASEVRNEEVQTSLPTHNVGD